MSSRKTSLGARVFSVLRFLQARADNIAVILLIAMFGSFMLQIIFRYIIREPLGWTLEACLMTWLWTVFWGSAFLVRDNDHVRFDVLFLIAPKPVRRILAIISAIAISFAFIISFPRVWDYITFMKIESSSVLKIRLDYLFSVYAIFAVAIIIRYIWRALIFIKGLDPDNELENPLALHGDDPRIE